VEPDDIDAIGARLGLAVEHRQRTRPDGTVIRWRAVGVDEAWNEPWRCAYMAWDDPALHPGGGAVDHPNGATGLGTLEVGVPSVEAPRAWTGAAELPGVHFAISGADDDLRLRLPLREGHVVFRPGGWRVES
jgi:hypothetical protein